MIVKAPLTFPLTYTQSYSHPYPYIKTAITGVFVGLWRSSVAEKVSSFGPWTKASEANFQ